MIFTSQGTEGDDAAYGAMAEAMMRLAMRQPGCFGAESVRDATGLGITVSYFTDEAAVLAWKRHAMHLAAQHAGRKG